MVREAAQGGEGQNSGCDAGGVRPGFWKPDGPYAVERSAHGREVSRGYLDISEGYTCNHVLPAWGPWRLRDLEARRIEAWVVDPHRQGELAPATVNKALQCLRTVLDRAVVDGLLPANPAERVKPLHAPRPSRAVLTPAEAARLLATPEPWSDYRHYAINVLAATTE